MDELLTRLRKVFDSQDQLPGSACAGQPTAGLSSKEGRRRRAPHPLSGVQSRRQAIGTSRLPIPLPRMIVVIVKLQTACLAPPGGYYASTRPRISLGPFTGPRSPSSSRRALERRKRTLCSSICRSSRTPQSGSLSEVPYTWNAWVVRRWQSRWPRMLQRQLLLLP